jgi:hypothetical protein
LGILDGNLFTGAIELKWFEKGSGEKGLSLILMVRKKKLPTCFSHAGNDHSREPSTDHAKEMRNTITKKQNILPVIQIF